MLVCLVCACCAVNSELILLYVYVLRERWLQSPGGLRPWPPWLVNWQIGFTSAVGRRMPPARLVLEGVCRT